MKLSVTLATYNEEQNLYKCLESIKDIAHEIIIVDGNSTDNTVQIAKNFNAIIETRENPVNFHINKQLANDLATGDWILQLDADEVVSPELKNEIISVLSSTQEQINNWHISDNKKKLFIKQQQILQQRDGQIGTPTGDVVAFFIPRRNIFLGHSMNHTGVYPDGVIRLFQKGKARLPAKNVHEQYQVDGRLSWLNNDLDHYDSPTFDRYIKRNSRYASHFALKISESNPPRNILTTIKYLLIKPLSVFLSLYIRHKGFKDGFPGLVFSYYSGLTWAQAYIKYWEHKELNKLSVIKNS